MRRALPLLTLTVLLGDCLCAPLAGEGEGEEGEGEEGEGEGGLGLAPELCLDGWCWENPRPFGFDIEGVWPVGPDDVWLVVTGGRMVHWDGQQFETGQVLEGAVRGFVPHRLFGTSPTSIWAAAGNLYHFDGAVWSRVETTLPPGALLGSVFGVADDDLWVVGQTPPLLAHFDGATWTDHTPEGIAPNTLMFTGQALRSDDAWAVGSNDTVLHWDGLAWTPRPVGDPSAIFEGVWMSASDDVWITGRTPSAMFHWDGAAWSSEPAPNARPLSHLWGSASDDIWGGGPNGVLHHWNGQAWSAVDFLSLPTSQLGAVQGRAGDDIWTVGDGGVIARFNGQTWTRPGQGEALTGFFVDVAGVVAGDAPLMVAAGPARLGGDGVFRRDDVGSWSRDELTPPFLEDVHAVTLTGPDDVWLGTREGLLHFDGATWSPVVVDETLGPAHDLCAFADTDVLGLFPLADNSDPAVAVARFDGSGWTVEATFTDVSADPSDEMTRGRLFCLDDGSAFAGGPGFVLRHSDGSWVRDEVAGDPGFDHPVRIQRVGDAVMAVDAFGRIWTRDATTWTVTSAPAELRDRDVSAAVLLSASEAWLLDDSGVLEHLESGVRTRALNPFFFGLQAIEQVGDDIFVVGGFGAVLRRQR